MLLWAGDITARRWEPAASSVRGRAEEAQGLFVPSEDSAVAIEKGSREQTPCPAPLPPPPPRLSSSSSLTGYTDGVLWIKIRSRARGWGGSQSISPFAFETRS